MMMMMKYKYQSIYEKRKTEIYKFVSEKYV